MISGTISLYDRSGELVDTKAYRCVSERKEVIKNWKANYGEGYAKLFIQIAPTANDYPLTHKDGTNKKHT